MICVIPAMNPNPNRMEAAVLPATGAMESSKCPRCGGSGILRLDEQRCRTCLECLGQGQLRAGSIEDDLFYRAISAAASVASAG